MLPIQRKITQYNRTIRSNKKNEYIVIHYVGAVSSAKNNAVYYANNKLKASAHYFVDENSIWQSVEDKDNAWHCGGGLQGANGHTFHQKCTNANSIGIEMCCKKNSLGVWYFEEETVKNTIDLVEYLMKKYNIPIDRVIRHYDVTGKQCPAPYVNENSWAEFKNKIKGKGELTMTQYEELKKQIENLTLALEKANKVYHSWGELPSYASPIIRELYNKGVYQGSSASDLNLPESLMRSLVINYRAGLYK